ncbi:MAG: serine hydrolase [Bacteroidales bacterium]|nr:serine hydrolase [Bacteroidales bacterium]
MKLFIVNISRYLILVIYTYIASDVFANDLKTNSIPPTSYIYDNIDYRWVDSVFNMLTLEEKIGQLLMIDAHPAKNLKHWNDVLSYVRDYKVGGIILFKGGPVQYANMINMLQDASKIPLLVALDAEWGLAMRMDSAISFPMAMALSAIDDEEEIYTAARVIAQQLKRLGIHINFAPVLDVNNNPQNPVINTRSFSDNKKHVVYKASYYMRGLHDEKILAVGKHFPGHGNTDIDSHKDLPQLNCTYKQLDTLELYPFKQLFKKGLSSVMIAHLDLPKITGKNNLPATLSEEIINNILRRKMKFNGIVFTDALNMKGVTKYYSTKQIAVMALKAGADVLLYPESVPEAFKAIKEAIEDSIICIDELNEKVKKILKLKYWVGLYDCKKVDLTNLYKDLNNECIKALAKRLYNKSVTVLRNDKNLIPLKRLDTLKIAYLNFYNNTTNTFQTYLKYYANIKTFNFNEKYNEEQLKLLKDSLNKYNLIITSLHQINRYAVKTFNVSKQFLSFLEKVDSLNIKIIMCFFTSPYLLNKMPWLKNIETIILCYENNNILQEIVPQIIFGGLTFEGKLPVNVSEFKFETGYKSDKIIRLSYVFPEELGISSEFLNNKIDSVINNAIKSKIFPGCQILAAQNGKVFYYKSFGNLFYDSIPVTNFTIYDLASLTKPLSTTISLMKLYDDNLISLKSRISDILDYTSNTNKADLILSDILAHQARLQAWIPFYKSLLSDTINYYKYFSNTFSQHYSIKIADNFYTTKFVLDTIRKMILHSHLLKEKKYLYSDLGFYLLKDVIEIKTGQPLNTYSENMFYKKLGAYTTTFNPLEKFNKQIIAPTENDIYFRKQLVWGYVHDQGAALFGGVQGHAGLFSNANDIAKILQMLLNGGTYADEFYLNKNTINLFTSCYNCPQNRRGLGFDKPEPNYEKESPVTRRVSMKTYGHQGFTGTCFWTDPEKKLIFIFLSNRVHPSADNNKINKLNIRNKILDIFYEAIDNKFTLPYLPN